MVDGRWSMVLRLQSFSTFLNPLAQAPPPQDGALTGQMGCFPYPILGGIKGGAGNGESVEGYKYLLDRVIVRGLSTLPGHFLEIFHKPFYLLNS